MFEQQLSLVALCLHFSKYLFIQFHSYCHLNFYLFFWVTLYKKHLKQSILLFVGAAAYYCVPSHSHMPTSHLKCLLVKPRSCAIYWGIRINWFFSLAQFVTYPTNDIEWISTETISTRKELLICILILYLCCLKKQMTLMNNLSWKINFLKKVLHIWFLQQIS